MSEIIKLLPKRKELVFDLLEKIGLDTSDWKSSYSSKNYKANPKYCYEWGYAEPGRFIVLNLWHDSLILKDSIVSYQGNYRDDALVHSRPGGKPAWARRANKVDLLLQSAFKYNLPIYVIINDGSKRNTGDPNATPSVVTARQLDSEIWSVRNYDSSNGEFELYRSAPQEHYVDQFDLNDFEQSKAKKIDVFGSAYVRSRTVRAHALTRAAGRCEYCGEPGFRMENGSIYLETHHIVPLGEGGNDTATNVIALCPNDHKKAHYSIGKIEIEKEMKTKISNK
ncbi:HNH endonuclease signature motif containing protein [Iodidimonas sp. SYSU 1G8]|uniref:HNH endonuclease n=1 Tax=Iodidimonas sp. SYSU 1G8 TaxID=3133967 RepID=UPI0031FE4A2B